MFTTGTSAYSASPRSRSSLLVRSPITAAWRENTSAVSRIDSPRVSCSSFARSTIGWPPSSKTPASIDVRVRVDGCSNSSAAVFPSSTRDAQRRRLQRDRAVEQRVELGSGQLLAGEEMAWQVASFAGRSRAA